MAKHVVASNCVFAPWSQSISYYSVRMTRYISYGMYSFVVVHHPFRMICYELQLLYVTNCNVYNMLRIAIGIMCYKFSKRMICFEFQFVVASISLVANANFT